MVYCTEILDLDINIASSDYDFRLYFEEFANLNPNKLLGNDFVTIGGKYLAKNVNCNIYVKVNYNKKNFKVAF